MSRIGKDSLQKVTKETKILTGTLKEDFVALVFFYSICSGQNHSGDAVFENRLMKIDSESVRELISNPIGTFDNFM